MTERDVNARLVPDSCARFSVAEAGIFTEPRVKPELALPEVRDYAALSGHAGGGEGDGGYGSRRESRLDVVSRGVSATGKQNV